MKTLSTVLVSLGFMFGGTAVHADETSSFAEFTACQRPPPGSVAGACEIRNKRASGAMIDNWHSPYVIHKWWACLQDAQHLPSGGMRDAIFHTQFIAEWKREIDANLATLRTILSAKHREELDMEQKAWERALERWQSAQQTSPQPMGTMYLMFSAGSESGFYSDRAIELACRVEKFSRE
jgi:hypothetical protein